MSAQSTSRRNFIKGAGLVGAASLVKGPEALAAEVAAPSKGAAKNLIFLVADGMGTGTLSLAHFWQLRHKSEPLNWSQIFLRPGVFTTLQDTASASSVVTDSAAAASAWGCGQRVMNRSINVTPSGESPTPIWVHAKERGKATGLVSTCRVTHATSAGFAANVKHRDMEDRIAEQYLERGIDVILGGGSRHFTSDQRDLLPKYEEAGFALSRDSAGLKKAAGEARMLGLFSESHVPYAIDRENDASLASVPSLEEMFSAALESLGGADRGFVLQVESGRVDHAGHGNDPATILRELLEFDRCIRVAEDFIAKNPDTLLILTTDHGTGGCQLNGLGADYGESGPALDRINGFTRSFEALAEHYQSIGRFDPDHFEEYTGFTASLEQITFLQNALEEGVKYYNSALTKAFADELFKATAVGWTSSAHTAEFVELLALGPGAETVPSFIKNYELNGILRKALAI